MLDYMKFEEGFCPYFGFIEEREEYEQLMTEEEVQEVGYDENNEDYLSEK